MQKTIITTFFLLFAICAYSQTKVNKGTIEHCYDLVIDYTSDSLPAYYINVDWKEKCARVVAVDKIKKTRDTMYLYDRFQCTQSKGIEKERLKKVNKN